VLEAAELLMRLRKKVEVMSDRLIATASKRVRHTRRRTAPPALKDLVRRAGIVNDTLERCGHKPDSFCPGVYQMGFLQKEAAQLIREARSLIATGTLASRHVSTMNALILVLEGSCMDELDSEQASVVHWRDKPSCDATDQPMAPSVGTEVSD